MKELITISAAFIIVVALAMFLYVSTEKHSIAVKENDKINELMIESDKKYNELKNEVEILKAHILRMDSIYHKK